MPIWYYTNDGTTQHGPVSQEELQQLIRDGRLNSSSRVWREGMPQWVYASTVGELFPKGSPPPLPVSPPPIQPPLNPPPLTNTGNTSGQGNSAPVPPEIKGWNWGAFGLAFFWSISHNVWIGLLSIIPYLGLIMAIVLGVKGNEWAWQSRRWESVEQFKAHQRSWAIATLVGACIALVLVLGLVLGSAG